MSLRALFVEPGGEQWLPVAKGALAKLKMVMNLTGLDFGKKMFPTPDGNGTIFVRTRRGSASRDAAPFAPDINIDDWFDEIRITVAIGTYVFFPLLKRLSDSKSYITGDAILASGTDKLVPEITGQGFSPFLDYTDASRFPTITTKEKAVTSAVHSGSFGAFSGKVFSTITSQPANPLGSFQRTYIDPMTQANVNEIIVAGVAGILPFTFQLYNPSGALSVTGDALVDSYSGTQVTPSYVASRDGKSMVVEFTLPEDRFFVTIDDSETPEIISTRIVDATPYGTTTSTTTTNVLPGGAEGGGTRTSHTNGSAQAEFPVSRGVNKTGQLVAITIKYDDLNSGNQTTTSVYWPPPAISATSGTSTQRSHLALTMPNGNSKVFDSYTFDSSGSNSGDGSGSFNSSSVSGVISVIYSDPSVPICVYEYVETTSITASSGGVDPITNSMVTSITTTRKREVGVMTGGGSRTLFTEGPSTPVVTVGSATVFDYVADGSSASSSTVTSNTNITTNPHAARLRYMPPFSDSGWPDQFSIVVRDVANWIIGVTKTVDINGNQINTFDIYASGVSGPETKRQLIDYFHTWLLTHDPGDTAEIAALAAGDISPFEILLQRENVSLNGGSIASFI